MHKSTKRLGRGLSALISPEAEALAEGNMAEPEALQQPPTAIAVSQIRPNPFQPRKNTVPDNLLALAESIRVAGIIQPIIVRRQTDDLYEIIVGERRWRAAQMAGLSVVPAIVRQATDAEMLEMALVENIFREDLNAIDRASAYRRYCDQFNLSADDVAQRLGEDRSTVSNYLRLLDLPSEVRDFVAHGSLAMGHARCLLAIKSPSDLVRTAKLAIDRALSVRALEELVRQRVEARAAAAKSTTDKADTKRAQVRSLEQAFIRALGTKVEIHESRRKGSGRIVIHYYGLDDFDRVAARLGVTNQD